MIALIVICFVSLISSTNCQQPVYHRLSPKYGTNDGNENSFGCPANGAITTIKYVVQQYIYQLEFVCSSLEAIESFGPYGTPKGDTSGELKCPPGQYISSFYGKSRRFVSHLGVRCREINEDLKGNGTDLGKVIKGTFEGDYPEFDTLAYSNGARPVGVKMWTSLGLEALQIDFANSPVGLCTANCTEYKEESAPLHGGTDGEMSVFTCPDQGVVTELTTMFESYHVTSLQFTCSSGLGRTVLERIGPDTGTNATVQCPPGTIIGSIHGRATNILTAIGIRCVEFGETGSSPKFDVQGGPDGNEFDDEEYSNRGWRPVQIRVYYNTFGINGIQIKYGNSAVSTNCRVTRIEITDDTIEAKSDGFEVIGVSSATTCETGTRLLKLDYSREVTEEVGVETADGGDVNWGAEVSISATTGVSLFGAKAEVSLGVSASTGGSKSWSTANSNSTATSTGAASGTEIYYDTPGACVIVGYVDRYVIDRDFVPVRYHYTCQIGELPPKLSNIKLQAKSYGNSYFEEFQFKFGDKSKCTRESRTCVKALNANKILVDTTAFEQSFYNCFPPGSGEVSKKITLSVPSLH